MELKQDVILFGRGNYCKFKLDSVKNKYNIKAILDNAVSIEEYDEDFGVYVYNPENIEKYKDNFVICMSSDFDAMYRQLRTLGIKDDLIDFGVNIEPHYRGFDVFAFGKGQKIVTDNGSLSYQISNDEKYKFSTKSELKSILRKLYIDNNDGIRYINMLPLEPYGRTFGTERGKAVDRVYIERFLKLYNEDIKGSVMEIASPEYTRMFGKERVTEEIVLHVKGWGNTIKGNFETGEGIENDMADCLICTQTLQYVFNLQETAKNIYKLLKKNGVALITVPGIKSLSIYDDSNWGEKWSFTKKSMLELFEPLFGIDNISIKTYGNVKVATAYLYGLCAEDLETTDFDYDDDMFPFLITVKLIKRGE